MTYSMPASVTAELRSAERAAKRCGCTDSCTADDCPAARNVSCQA